MRSWAAAYVGRPWAPGADGPLAFNCWGLVRHVFKTREGIDLPLVAVDESESVDPGNIFAIKQAARVAGMRRVGLGRAPQVMDVAVLLGPGTAHVGIVVLANGRLSLLHSSHAAGVKCEPFAEATAGYSVELWRRKQ